MTAAPSPASAAPVPTGRRRGPVAPRPDDRLALLEAIQRRDAPQARRLAERWVHRRGLASLEAFERQWLVAEAGPESSGWFGELLQRSIEPSPAGAGPSPAGAESHAVGVVALSAAAAALGPEICLEDLDLDPAFAIPPSPLPSVEEAFAALAAEFAPAASASPPTSAPFAAGMEMEMEIEMEMEMDPSPAELERIARGGLDQVDPSLLPPLPQALSFAIAPAIAEPTLGATDPSVPSPVPSQPETPDAPLQGADAVEPAPAVARPWFGRVRGLLRTCVEEAIGGLGQAPSAEVPPTPEAALLAAEAATEPLAPWPAFHPTASILAVLPDPPAPAAAPAPARWLPRLGLVSPSPRPAPAPADLADLRAWLPDAADDLPRAC